MGNSFVAEATAILKKGEGRLLKSGSAWIFDNEVDEVQGNFENGGRTGQDFT